MFGSIGKIALCCKKELYWEVNDFTSILFAIKFPKNTLHKYESQYKANKSVSLTFSSWEEGSEAGESSFLLRLWSPESFWARLLSLAQLYPLLLRLLLNWVRFCQLFLHLLLVVLDCFWYHSHLHWIHSKLTLKFSQGIEWYPTRVLLQVGTSQGCRNRYSYHFSIWRGSIVTRRQLPPKWRWFSPWQDT